MGRGYGFPARQTRSVVSLFTSLRALWCKWRWHHPKPRKGRTLMQPAGVTVGGSRWVGKRYTL